MKADRPKVVVIGGGGTGGALAYDLALRGCEVRLFERGELTSGTTGRHHGQLHCGARYAVKDRNIGRECLRESEILRRIAPEAIEFNGGLFIAVDDRDLAYLEPFLQGCAEAEIPARRLTPREALGLEPALNPGLKAAVRDPGWYHRRLQAGPLLFRGREGPRRFYQNLSSRHGSRNLRRPRFRGPRQRPRDRPGLPRDRGRGRERGRRLGRESRGPRECGPFR